MTDEVAKHKNKINFAYNASLPPHIPNQDAILDSGTTGNYLTINSPVDNLTPTPNGVRAKIPDGTILQASHRCELRLPQLPAKARIGHIFTEFKNPLLSVALLCDSDCKVNFTKQNVTVKLHHKTILTGYREQQTGLWRVQLSDTTNNQNEPGQANSILPAGTIADTVKFLHQACFSPATSTFIKAIEHGNFATWPMLTSENVKKYLPKSEATAMGHLDQQRKNTLSTKRVNNAASQSGTLRKQETDNSNDRTHNTFADIMDINEPTGQIYTDQTGRFPVQSSRGYKYIMILYDHDSNAILAEPMKSRSDHEMIRAYEKLHSYLTTRGLKPKLQRLDNEASTKLKNLMRTKQVDFQLAPPHIHRRNAAERAIRTWKNHFIAGLASTDKKFPIHLWDRLIPQAVTTLNLLRQSRINPRLSSDAQLNGIYDYNRAPMAPPGTKVIIHETPAQRGTWSPHGERGWYLGPAPDHYRCYRLYVTKTAAERTCGTVEFFPEHCPMPRLSSTDTIAKSALDLIEALRNPAPAAPFAKLGDERLAALQQLATIFRTSTTPQLPRVEPKEKHTQSPPRVAASAAKPAPPRYHTRSQTRTQQCNHIQTQPSSKTMLITPEMDGIPTFPLTNAVIDPDTGTAHEYRQLIADPKTRDVWLHAAANEFGRLAQGVKTRIKGTNTINFIHRAQVPTGRTVTYARFCANIRPQKEETHRCRITVGGDRIDYPGEVSTKTAGLTTIKLLLNSVISKPTAKFMTADVKNFYLNTPLERPEYMRIPVKLIPQEIIDDYNLMPKVTDGFVYVEINKGMYGLPQAGLLANKLLARRLAKYGYYQAIHTPGLWKHTWRPIQFVLVVDDFGVEYEDKKHATHLLDALNQHYEAVSEDWKGLLFCGIKLDWDYTMKTVDLSMPGYITQALHKFQHETPKLQQHAPHKHNEVQYGRKIQLTEPADTSPPLSKDDIKRLQQIIGTLLYYARAVDSTMLVALSDLSSAQAHGTESTNLAASQLLDYCATHSEASIRYCASEMALQIHSDASYLSVPKGRSRAGGHIYLGAKSASSQPILNNGAVLTISGIIKHVMSSAAEAEVAGLFINAKEGEILRTTLQEMGYTQEATPIQTDNSTASGIANDTINQQRSRSIDMRFYWVRDRVKQGHFKVFWAPGKTNLADYFTKHHPPRHHQRIRSTYIHQSQSKTTLPNIAPSIQRGCVHPTNSTPSQSPTNSTPKLNTRANDGQRISQQVMARAAAVIGTMAFRLTN